MAQVSAGEARSGTATPVGGEALVVLGVAIAAALVLLGPALAPGAVLTYDMVWVPDLELLRDTLGLGSGLPRAVPSDAVVAALDEVVPGLLLQKLVLLGALVAAGTGAARLIRAPLLARLAVVVLVEWNAFVVERLLIGHWPVLLGYGLLPWLILLARRWREDDAPPSALLLVLPLASLSASAGIASAVALAAGAPVFARAGRRGLPGRGALRARLTLLALLALANAPWVVAGLVHAGSAAVDPAGARAFALNDEGSVPAPIAALTLGGVWNAEVVPDSRAGALGWITLLVLGALAAAGARRWWSTTPQRERRVLLVCWALGWLAAVATWAAPDLLGRLGEHVPGLAVMRDGGRSLVLCAPLLAVLVGNGVALALERVRPAAAAALPGVLLLPIALLPDAAWGATGRLAPAHYPAAWASVRADLQRDPTPGDLLVLPLSAFRAPGWNDGRIVFDPLGRYLGRPFLSSDVLVVSGRALPGEDPRVRSAAAALQQPTATERTRALLALGVGAVVVDDAAPAADRVPALAGEEVAAAGGLRVLRLDGPPVAAERAPGVVHGVGETVVVTAWLAWLVGLGAGALGVAGDALRRRRAFGPNDRDEGPGTP
ncbi:hypothetical protein [Nocardioides sp.]|uniref:hypothetical protein n=1 Tax=Nocardioides sp. TaxID=35761 RepID=UPI0035185304